MGKLGLNRPIPTSKDYDFRAVGNNFSAAWKNFEQLDNDVDDLLNRLSDVETNVESLQTGVLTEAEVLSIITGALSSSVITNHALLSNLNSTAYSHLTSSERAELTGGLSTALHYHDADRARANHTGTQLAATISDFQTAARLTISATLPVLYNNVTGVISLAGLAALGTSNQLLGMNNAGTAYEYKTLAGTANRVTVTHGVGTITISGPQDIHTGASPQFVGETLTGNLTMSTGNWLGLGAAGLRMSWDGASAEIDVLGGGFDMNSYDIAHGGNIHADAGKLYSDTETANTLVYLDASHGITTMGAATNGQLAIGSTGAAPVLATLTGTANQITVTNGAGTITLSIPNPAVLGGLTVSSLTITGFAGILYGTAGVIAAMAAGTQNYVPKYNNVAGTTIGNSLLYDTGSGVVIGTTTAASLLEIYSATANPILTITAAHATDYDPQIQFRTDASPTVKWSMGVDGTNDWFYLTDGSWLAGNVFMYMTTFDVHIGRNAGKAASGTNNMGIGYLACGGNGVGTSGNYNLCIGYSAGRNITSGMQNFAIGYNTLAAITTQSFHTAIGANVLAGSSSVSPNTAIGYASQYNNTTGGDNVSIGSQSLYGNNTGSTNVCIGDDAGYTAAGTNITGNTFIGHGAGRTCPTNYNVGIGYRAGYNASTTSNSFVAIGGLALSGGVSRYWDIAIGYYSMATATSAEANVCIGAYSANQLTTGDRNTCIGNAAGWYQQTGSYNTMIGSEAGTNTGAYSVSNSVFVGYYAGFYETATAKLFIDTFNRTNEATARISSLIYGEFSATVANQIFRVNGTIQLYQDSLYMKWGAAGDCGIMYDGTNMVLDARLVGTGNLKIEQSIKIKEQAAADADTAAYGQLWIKSSAPNELWFTDDSGIDRELLGATAVTSETVTADRTVTVRIGGATYKLVAYAVP